MTTQESPTETTGEHVLEHSEIVARLTSAAQGAFNGSTEDSIEQYTSLENGELVRRVSRVDYNVHNPSIDNLILSENIDPNDPDKIIRYEIDYVPKSEYPKANFDYHKYIWTENGNKLTHVSGMLGSSIEEDIDTSRFTEQDLQGLLQFIRIIADHNKSPEQLQADQLTSVANNVLDAYEIEPVTEDNGVQVREVKSPNDPDCSLTATTIPDGLKSVTFIRRFMSVESGEEVEETVRWVEGSPSAELKYVSENMGTRNGRVTSEQVLLETKYNVAKKFPIPEKAVQKPKDRIQRILGHLGLATSI